MNYHRFVTGEIRRALLVDQELLTLLKHLIYRLLISPLLSSSLSFPFSRYTNYLLVGEKILLIKSPKQSFGDLLFLLRFLLSLPNKVWGTYCFCSVSYYYFYYYYSYSFFPRSMNLSTADLRN